MMTTYCFDLQVWQKALFTPKESKGTVLKDRVGETKQHGAELEVS